MTIQLHLSHINHHNSDLKLFRMHRILMCTYLGQPFSTCLIETTFWVSNNYHIYSSWYISMRAKGKVAPYSCHCKESQPYRYQKKIAVVRGYTEVAQGTPRKPWRNPSVVWIPSWERLLLHLCHWKELPKMEPQGGQCSRNPSNLLEEP